MTGEMLARTFAFFCEQTDQNIYFLRSVYAGQPGMHGDPSPSPKNDLVGSGVPSEESMAAEETSVLASAVADGEERLLAALSAIQQKMPPEDMATPGALGDSQRTDVYSSPWSSPTASQAIREFLGSTRRAIDRVDTPRPRSSDSTNLLEKIKTESSA
jgi:hypothetical protein